MSTNGWWLLASTMVLLGAAAGAWLALRVARRRFDERLRRATEDLLQRNTTMAEQLRTARVRAQTELDQARDGFRRQLAALAAEPGVELERSEQRLKAALAELDRLRGKAASDSGPGDLTDGFAATRPMYDSL